MRSLKATLLTYARQRGVDSCQRAAQGQHQLVDANQCVELYGRDDVQPQLACQRDLKIFTQISSVAKSASNMVVEQYFPSMVGMVGSSFFLGLR